MRMSSKCLHVHFSDNLIRSLSDEDKEKLVYKIQTMKSNDRPIPEVYGAFVNDGQITYFPNEAVSMAYRTTRSPEEYARRRGITTKPGKFFRKFGITDAQELERLGSLFIEPEIEVVEGEDIRKYYHGNTYAQGSTSLQSSCMRGEEHQKYFGIYVDNLKMLICKNTGGKIIGRALIWEDCEVIQKSSDDVPDILTLVDRIYGPEQFKHQVTAWAWGKGYFTKTHQNYTSQRDLSFNHRNYKVTLKKAIIPKFYKYYPYFDTFIGVGWGSMCNDKPDNLYVLMQTVGGYGSGPRCPSCHIPRRNNELCPTCVEKAVKCSCCGEPTLEPLDIKGKPVCQDCVDNRFTQCDQCNTLALDHKMIWKRSKLICPDCVRS